MAAKRFLHESGSDPDHPNQKRTRTTPSLASVIREVVLVKCLENLCSALEPMFRKVVNEELEHVLKRSSTLCLSGCPSLRSQLAPETSSTLKLVFRKSLSLPIFTGTDILDNENNPLQILLVDTKRSGHDDHQVILLPTPHPNPIKLEIVVLDGDFPPGNRQQTWTSEEFDKNIVKERAGKRPLLTGDVMVTMREGFVSIGEIELTDNSSWIRSRKFRLGVRMVPGSTSHGVVVREAMTESFMVKDHRGELYKKHHPPMLEDEVWRLEKIGKEGTFHRKLASAGIHTVADFLKLSTVDPSKLRTILGAGMSEKLWEISSKHARTCVMGNKLYISHGPNYTIVFNPICQVLKALINGQPFSTPDLKNLPSAYMETLVRDAYANWSSLEQVDGITNDTGLLTQGDLMDQQQSQIQTIVRTYQQQEFLGDGSMEVGSVTVTGQVDCRDLLTDSPYLCVPVESGLYYNFSESSADGELT